MPAARALGGAPALGAVGAKVVALNAHPDRGSFGPVLNNVISLREAVGNGVVQPEQVVGFVMKAMEQIAGNEAAVPAVELLPDKMDEFFALLLPAAPEPFRIECARLLGIEWEHAMTNRAGEGGNGVEELPEGAENAEPPTDQPSA